MRTRTYMAGALSLMVNAVLFGSGVIAVLSIPALAELTKFLTPAVVAASIAASPLIAWYLASKLRLRYQEARMRR